MDDDLNAAWPVGTYHHRNRPAVTPSGVQIRFFSFVEDPTGKRIAQVLKVSDGSLYVRPIDGDGRYGAWVKFRGADEAPRG